MFLIASALGAELPVCAEFAEASAPIVVDGIVSLQSSGLTAARSHPGRFFTHDDAGGNASLYVFERTASGAESIGEQIIQGAVNTDWEDIATGPCPASVDAEWCLWIGDIGDNDKLRSSISVWVVPDTMDAGTTAVQCSLVYEDQKRYDAETLFVSPDGVLRIVTKEADGEAKIYRIDNPRCNGGAAQTLIREAEIFLTEEVTGGAMNDAGTAVVLRGPTTAWQWSGCDIVWTDPPMPVDLGVQPQGEAVTFLPDGNLVSSSEGEPFRIWETQCLETTQVDCPSCGCGEGTASPVLVVLPIMLARRRRAARRNAEGRT